MSVKVKGSFFVGFAFNMIKKLYLLTIISHILHACGGEIPDDLNQKSNTAIALTVPNISALPECKSERENHLVYLQSKEIFLMCDSTAWQNVKIKAKESNQSLVNIVEEREGDDCLYGGQRISIGIDINKNNLLEIGRAHV